MLRDSHLNLKNLFLYLKKQNWNLIFLWQVSISMVSIYKKSRFLHFVLHNENHQQVMSRE